MENYNKKPVGALFLPVFAQICLPYVLCRLSPLAIALQTSSSTMSLLRFWFRKCLNADKLSGVLNMVGHNCWYVTARFTSSLSAPPYQLLHFNASFTCFGNHDCDLAVREQAKSKVWSKNQLLSMPVGIKIIIPV